MAQGIVNYSSSDDDSECASGQKSIACDNDFFFLDSPERTVEETEILFPMGTFIDACQLAEVQGPCRPINYAEPIKSQLPVQISCKAPMTVENFRVPCDSAIPLEKNFQAQPSLKQQLPFNSHYGPHSKFSEGSRQMYGHNSCVNSLHWRVTDQIRPLLLSASSDHSIKVWNVSEGNVIFSSAVHGMAIKCARWNRQGLVASGGYDKVVKVIDIEKDLVLCNYQHKAFVNCLVFHPNDDNLLLSGSFDRIDLWDVRANPGASVRSYESNCHEVNDIVFLPDLTSFLCCTSVVTRDCADRSIMVWDLKSGALLSNQIFQEKYHSVCLRVHPGGKCFVAQTNGDYLAQFSTVMPYKMNKYRRFEGHKVSGYAVGCDFSPDGKHLISGSADGTLHTYDFQKGRSMHIRRVSSPRVPVLSVECCPDQSNRVAIASWDGLIQIL